MKHKQKHTLNNAKDKQSKQNALDLTHLSYGGGIAGF